MTTSQNQNKEQKLEEALGLAEATLRLIATPARPDGTYNRCREACEIEARNVLDKINSILYPTKVSVKDDWNLDTRLAVEGEVCKISGREPSRWVCDDETHTRWFNQDLDKLLSFEKPLELINVYEHLIEKFGDFHLTIGVTKSWHWRDFMFRDKTVRAAGFYGKIWLWKGDKPLKDYVRSEKHLQSEYSSICHKCNILVEISDLFAISAEFNLPAFQQYSWNETGFVISCNSKKHTEEIKKEITEFFLPDSEEIIVDANGRKITVNLKNYW
jgi:hypothetical protein